MTALSKLGKAALAYAGKGWPVFPVHGICNGYCTCGNEECEHPGKHPCTPHGFKDATVDPQKITVYWRRWPSANIGYAVTGHIVFDPDGAEGSRVLAELQAQYGKLPETLKAKTGRGEHFYFQADGLQIRPSAGKFGKHFDIRTVGSYTILPPSIHVTEKVYEWANRDQAAPLPATWIQLLADPHTKESRTKSAGEKIREGQRNAHLASLAGSMRRRGMSLAAIGAALLRENEERCEPSLSQSEVKRIAASVSRYDPAKPGAQQSNEAMSVAKMRSFSSIDPEPLRWLWQGRIPLGKLTVIAGDPGLGKSLLTIDIAARLSIGAVFPDGSPSESGSVIFLSAEDDAADTIRPRLDAAGAEVSRVHLLDAVRNVTADGKNVETSFNLERDIDALEDAIRQTGARLIVIDPISAYLGGTDSHKNSAVRGLLSPLAALAGKYKVAVVAVTHLRKSTGAAIHRIAESLAFCAAARAAWGVAPDPDNQSRQLFAPIKQNLGRAGGLAYRIEAPNDIARIAWDSGAIVVDVNAVMGGFESREANSERREAEEWLRDILADGPMTRKEIEVRSKSVGLKWATVRRAADSVGVIHRKLGGRGIGWEWVLPGESENAHFKDAHPREGEVSTFDNPAENNGCNGHSKVKDAHVSTREHLCQESAVVETPKMMLSARERAERDPLIQGFIRKFDCRIAEVQDLQPVGETL